MVHHSPVSHRLEWRTVATWLAMQLTWYCYCDLFILCRALVAYILDTLLPPQKVTITVQYSTGLLGVPGFTEKYGISRAVSLQIRLFISFPMLYSKLSYTVSLKFEIFIKYLQMDTVPTFFKGNIYWQFRKLLKLISILMEMSVNMLVHKYCSLKNLLKFP